MRSVTVRSALVFAVLLAAILVPTVASSQSQPSTYSLFPSSATPGRPGGTDQLSVELGLKFTVDAPGTVTAIRFYKGAISNPQHTVSLWTADGQLVGRGATTTESASGWQEATLPAPVSLVPGTTYVASYHTNGYTANQNYFANPVNVGPLHAPASTPGNGNGVFRYGPQPTFPSSSYLSSNYWVDVVFAPAAQTPPLSTATSTSTSPVTVTATSTAVPAATSTLTPTATSTAVLSATPTQTSTSLPTSTSTPTQTSTPTRTATAVPGTSTPTPTAIPPSGFVCSEIVGFSETEEWYFGGFITSVPNPSNWQLRWYSGGSIDLWAQGRAFSGWGTSNLATHCANGSAAPDRVIINVSGDYNTDATYWAKQTQAVIDYVRTVYSPNVKQIVVQPVVGGPASSLCGTAASPPTSWVRASYNFPAIKAGLQQVLSSQVVLGADPQVRSCADYMDTVGHLANGATGPIGAAIAGYYSQPPR